MFEIESDKNSITNYGERCGKSVGKLLKT